MQSLVPLLAGGAFLAVLMAWRLAQLVKLHGKERGSDQVLLHRHRSEHIQAISAATRVS